MNGSWDRTGQVMEQGVSESGHDLAVVCYRLDMHGTRQLLVYVDLRQA